MFSERVMAASCRALVVLLCGFSFCNKVPPLDCYRDNITYGFCKVAVCIGNRVAESGF
jgi:hypothetical protein